jgi:hypothetical protein
MEQDFIDATNFRPNQLPSETAIIKIDRLSFDILKIKKTEGSDDLALNISSIRTIAMKNRLSVEIPVRGFEPKVWAIWAFNVCAGLLQCFYMHL